MHTMYWPHILTEKFLITDKTNFTSISSHRNSDGNVNVQLPELNESRVGTL